MKFGTGERTVGPLPHCQISRLSGQKCGNTAPKTVKISNFGQKFVLQGRLVCNIFTKFSAFVCVYRHLLSFYFGHFRGTNTQVISIFPRWGHFPTNFQWPLVTKPLIASKKVRRMKKWDGPPLSPCEVWCGSWVARRL